MMMQWIKGEHASAAKIDPAFAALIAAIVEILVRFNLHDKIGLTPEQLMTTLLDIAFVALMIRSIQTNVGKKSKAANDPPPAASPDAGDTAA